MPVTLFSAKTAPAIIPAITGGIAVSETGVAIDPVTIAAVAVGLLAGALWRIGDMTSDKRPWKEIKSDLVTSAFTGLANAIIAMAIIEWVSAGPLYALGIAAVTGASGTQMLKWVMSAVRDKITKTGD